MEIQAAVLYETNAPFQIETLELEAPGAHEVLIRMGAAGICHSDYHLVTGHLERPLPIVPGHEGAGTVTEIGSEVTRVQVGDRVMLSWLPNCGTCFYCLVKRPNLCQAYMRPIWDATMLDGTVRLSKNKHPIHHLNMLSCWASHAVVPEESCIPLQKEVPFDVAALIGCAVTTGVGAALKTAEVTPGSSVAVFGSGGVGLSIIMGARLAGAARIIVVTRTDSRASLARELGATDCLTAGPDTNDTIRRLTEGRGADFVFDAVGEVSVQEQCFDALRPGGLLVLVGMASKDAEIRLPSAIMARQDKTVTGSYLGQADTAHDFNFYGKLFLNGQLPIDRLISKSYRLDQINEACSDMLSGKIARGAVVFEGPR